jgi:hypothetical protein
MYHFTLPSSTASTVQFKTEASARFKPDTRDCGKTGKSVIFFLEIRSPDALDSAMAEYRGMCISTLSSPEHLQLGTGHQSSELVAAIAALPAFKDRIRAPEPSDMAALGSHLLDEAATLLLQRGELQPALLLLEAVAAVERRSQTLPESARERERARERARER